MYQLIFSPETDQELLEAYVWYEEQKEGLGERFINDVNRAINKIQKNPLHYGVLRTLHVK